MRWKFIRIPCNYSGPDEPFPDVLDGNVEEAMSHLEQLAAGEVDGAYHIAATVGAPAVFGLPADWLLVDVTQNRRGWIPTHGLFGTARRAIHYELQRPAGKHRLFRVIRRDGTIAQLVLHPGQHHHRLGPR